MLNDSDRTARLRDFVTRAHALLEQRWLYEALPADAHQPESPKSEFACGADLLALLAELVGDIERIGEACAALVHEADALGLSRDDVRRLAGIDLSKFAVAHTSLAEELASAGNRALDLIGDAHNGS